jgi:hypothetical protein
MTTTGIAVELSTTCSKCQAPLPLNGASESVLCDHCRTPTATPPDLWQRLLGEAVGEAVAMAKNEGRTHTILMGSANYKLMVGRQDPRCACKTPFAQEAILRSAGTGSVQCSACGKPSAVRPAPAWIKAIHPAALLVVGETMGAQAAQRIDPKDLRFHCYHCGSALPLDGASRTVACAYCRNSVMVPDDIWLRLHPARTVDRWFVVLALDLSRAAGVLPEDVRDFCDVACEPGGNMVIAYLDNANGEAGHPARLALLDRNGAFLWLQDGVEFSDHARLFTSPADGSVYIVDPGERAFARKLDPRTGAPVHTLVSPPEDSSNGPLSVRDHDGFAIDWDGSFVVHRDWSDTGRTALRRFAPDGRRVPLWPGQRLAPNEDVDRPEWPRPPNKPVRLPSSARFGFGWDGAFYVVDEGGGFVAKYARDGQLVGVAPLPKGIAKRVHSFTVARDGTLSMLFAHAVEIADSDWTHLGRLLPDGRFFVALGPHAGDASSMIGKYTRMIKGAPDGTLFLARDVDDLRILGSDGRILWTSNATRRHDEQHAKELATARRGKRLVADRA